MTVTLHSRLRFRLARSLRWLSAALGVLVATGAAWSAEPPAVGDIVAQVDGQPISRRELDREIERAVQGRTLAAAEREAVRERALQQLIDRRLVLRHLSRNGLAASEQEIDRELRRIGAKLEQRGGTLDGYLQESGLTRADLRYLAAWEIGWPRFLERYATEENLRRYFEQHRRDFDGTEIEAAHILLRIEAPGDERARQAAVARATDLRARIERGEITFADAAQESSAAPTAADGGRLGFIGRHGPMPEAFSEVTFALNKGEVSPPVMSSFGVHLIRCLDIRPGKKTLPDVRDEVQRAAVQHLFRWAADQQRAAAKIELIVAG